MKNAQNFFLSHNCLATCRADDKSDTIRISYDDNNINTKQVVLDQLGIKAIKMQAKGIITTISTSYDYGHTYTKKTERLYEKLYSTNIAEEEGFIILHAGLIIAYWDNKNDIYCIRPKLVMITRINEESYDSVEISGRQLPDEVISELRQNLMEQETEIGYIEKCAA